MFIEWVTLRRGAKLAGELGVFTGEVWTRKRAHALGLVDGLGTMRGVLAEALSRRARAAGGLGALRALSGRRWWHPPRMAYDEALAQRLRDLLADEPDVSEKRMFGGLAFLAAGKLAVCAVGEGDLMLRCPPEETEALLAEPHAREMVMRGRVMRGWLLVDAEGVTTGADLRGWVATAVGYARSLG